MASLKWDPPCLTFPVALNKPAVQQLRTVNGTANTAFTYKVKTTNPKRYSVRPNVGVVYPGEEMVVSVQLPAFKELPADMQKCKDKFQVLTLPLDEATSNALRQETRNTSHNLRTTTPNRKTCEKMYT